MSRDLFALTWADFDLAVDYIADKLPGDIDGIIGIPRGGLPLAVALSHRLTKPLVQSPSQGARLLWIDDIVDSGKTLNHYRHQYPQFVYATWVQRGDHKVIAYNTLENDRWVLFPWEQKVNAQTDAQAYENSRQ